MKKKLILLGVIALLLPAKIWALTGNVVIECDNTQLSVNQTTQCYVKCKNFTDSVAAFHGKVTVDNKLSIIKITKDSSWEGAADNGVIDVYTDVNKSGNFNIASFEVKAIASGDGQITLSEIEITDSQFQETAVSNVVKTISVTGSNTPASQDPGPSTPTSQDTDDNVGVNPGTGSYIVWIVAAFLVLSAGICLILYRRTSNNE